MAEKIREVDDSRDLKRVAEDVLPQIEKFLESPEEKRLRRMRAGVITAASGLGASVVALLLLTVSSFKDPDAIPWLVFFVGLGLVTVLIGLGLIVNGRLLTQPPKTLKDSSADALTQSHLDAGSAPPQLRPGSDDPQSLRSPTTNELSRVGNSVTEHTTHLLNPER